MKPLNLIKLKKGLTRAAKSVLSITLAVLMVLSVYVALNVNFGIPGLIASAAESQTRYKNINEYQLSEFSRIQNEIFRIRYNNTLYYPNTPNTTNYMTASDLASYYSNSDYDVLINEGNDYFNWVDTDAGVKNGTISQWGGTSSTTAITPSGIIGLYDIDGATTNGQYFVVLEVNNANELYRALYQVRSYTRYNSSDYFNYIININTDIDMNGRNYYIEPFTAASSDQNQRVYIEGNGHTIYNLRIQAADRFTIHPTGATTGVALFSYAPRYFACKNLGFQSPMVLYTGSNGSSAGSQVSLLCAQCSEKLYLDNVHSVGAYMQTVANGTYGLGGLIGRANQKTPALENTNNSKYSGNRFINNCSTEKGVLFGGQHVGGLTSFIYCTLTETENNKKYDIDFPSDPFNIVMNDSTEKYPFMIFNSSSTDSTLFSLGADSGCFISCGSGIRAKNCYSNNTIYAENNTGGFIGRTADLNHSASPMIDDGTGAATTHFTVNNSFENCYSSGIVEGSVAMGGFVGMTNGRRLSTNSEKAIVGKGDYYSKKGVSVFRNCFSTAMVGMDYAGKYCGGFIGMDDVYNAEESSINVDNTLRSGYGCWYINCYAAGEVGNILTVTDLETARKYEGIYKGKIEDRINGFFGSSFGASDDRSTQSDGTTIFDYYPSGGFAGVVGLDRYRYHVFDRSIDDNTKLENWSGNFYNCYYDMQTTAMREMAVGMVECNTSSSNEPGINPNDLSKARPFSIAGVRGVYTAKSDTKKLVTISGNYVTADGSEEIPKETYDKNPAAYAGKTLMKMLGLTDMTDMDSKGAASTNWTYAQQYYPQISSMMVADLTKSSIKDVTTDDINNTTSGKNAESSVYFIPDSANTNIDVGYWTRTTRISSYTKPVLSLASVQRIPIGSAETITDETTGNSYTKQNYKPQVQTGFANLTAAAQMSEVVKAYRYSQAATATVFLDHWDLTMNTSTGDADNQDSGHVPSLDRNKMTRSGTTQINGKDVTLWSKTYTHLSADTYSFKINAGDSMAFSYGKTGFAESGDECKLEITVPNSDATIYFAFNELNTDYYLLYAEITSPTGEKTTTTWHTPPLEYREDPTPYILAGSFEVNGATNAETGVALPQWKENDFEGENAGTARLRYDPSRSDDKNRIYKLAVNCPAGEYSFKVTHSSWTDGLNWGVDGIGKGGSDMSLKLNADAQVTFLFNENTKKVTMEFDNPNKADAYNCGTHFVKREGAGIEGYSVLAHSEQIGINTNWYVNSPEGLEAAARAGLMNSNTDESEFTYSFTLSGDMWSKNYAYKIIKNGVDEGPNQCFYLDSAPTLNAPSTLPLTIHYYPNKIGNARFEVTCDDEEIAKEIHIDNNVAHYDSYGLTGVKELFGDSWLTSADYLMGVDENDEGVFVYSFDEINFRYLGYQDGQLPAGSYSFKVVAGNTWESGLDYGDAKGGNFTFNLVQPADKVTVKFDPRSEADCKITVDVSPVTALDTKNYVITASAAFASVLGVGEWKKNYEDAQPAFMLFNNGTQRFEKWVYGVNPNDNVTLDEWGDEGYPIWCYGFKVIPVGNDDNKPNLLIELTKARTSYDMYIGYDESEDKVYIYAFENTGQQHILNGQVNTEEALGYAVYDRSSGELLQSSEDQGYLSTRSLKPAFYSILGEESLTGYDWSGNYLPSARRGLLVPVNDGTNHLHLSEPYRVKGIKSQTAFGKTYSFKISAGGTWDVSYPPSNKYVTVAYPDNARSSSSWAKDECDIDIFFDPETHEVVDITAYNGANAMSYIFELNPDELQWYVAPTNKLYDQNMFSDQENVEVYDTVRDITSGFYFTYGSGSEQRGLMVENDAVRNTTDGFYTKDDFSLTYNMKEQYLRDKDVIVRRDTMEGNFHAEVIDLKNKTLSHDVAAKLSGNEKDSYNGFVLDNNDKLTKFYVEQFAPGKKWLKINTVGYGYSNEYKNWQQQFLTYNNYIDDKEKFDRYEKLFLQLCSSFPYQGGKVNEFTLYAYLNERKNDPSDEVYDSMVEALGYDILYWKNNLETRAANREDVEPSSVFDSNTQFIVGSRDIRLIPSSYLEAGVDANVNVVQKAGDEANASNSVRLNYNTTGYASDNYEFNAIVVDSVLHDNGEETDHRMVNDGSRMGEIDELSFGYYNYAMTSAFLSTDKIGLGIYNNYDDQFTANFRLNARRDDDDSQKRNSTPEAGSEADIVSGNNHRYFAMKSAYSTESDSELNDYRADYQGREEYSETDYTKRTHANLNAGYFNNMSIVGSTYDRNKTDEKEDAQTLVKIFKVDTDANGNYIMNADGSFKTTPVYFSNDTGSTTAYATNYKKWSGLTNFTAADTGYYEVQFNWVLSDGRYMQDTKYVDIKLVEPGITKTVNTEYETAGDNMLTYTIKYTNFNTELLVDFAILDILPFDGDVRYNPASGRINSTNLADREGDLKFKLKAVTIQQSSKSDVREVYFTNSEKVKEWLKKETKDESGATVITTNEKAANSDHLKLNESGFIENYDDVTWTPLGHADSSLQKYSPGRYTTIASGGTETELNHDATAVCLSGMQLATGQEITVEFTFAFDGKITDYYSNDAFYYIRATEATNTEDAGMSRPVGTAIVSRNLTGFAWLDNDGDGIIDEGEPKLQNMEVQLYRQISVTNPDTGVTTASYVDTGSKVKTDTNGFYKFENLESGYYEVRFTNPSNGEMYVIGSESKQVDFNDLRGTNKLREVNERRSETNVKEKGYSTRNLAVATQTNPEEQIEAQKKYMYSISGIYMPSNSLVYSNNNNQTMTNATDENYLYTRLFQNAGFGSIYDIDYKYSVNIDKTNDNEEKLEGVKFLFEYLNPNDGLWYPVKYKTVAEGSALETKVMDTSFTTPGELGDYTGDSWGEAVVEQFEAETVPENSRPIYIINKTGYDDPHLYYWGDTESKTWPGYEMRKVVSNTNGNVYVAYVVNGNNEHPIINFPSASGETNQKQIDLAYDGSQYVYTITKDDNNVLGGGDSGKTQSFREVYFVNTQGWDEVYAYGWGSDIYNVGTWPGYKMKQLTDTLWSTLIPTDMTGLIFNGSGSQTVDIKDTTLKNGTVFIPSGEKDGDNYKVNTDIVTEGKKVYYINNQDWNEVAAYSWVNGIAETSLLGGWPGTAMNKESDDVYSIVLTDDYKNIIFNNNNQGSQNADINIDTVDDLSKIYRTDLTDTADHKRVIGVYSGNTSAEDNPNRNIFFTNNYGWTGKIYVQTIGGANPSGESGIEMTLDHTNDYGEQMYVASVPKDTSKLVFFNILDDHSEIQNKTAQLDYSNEVQGWYITGREVNGSITITEDNYYYTDANGNIDLPKLIGGRYRVTEVQTLDDYLPFTEPIEFNLPFVIGAKVAADNTADYKVSLDEDYIESQDDNYINYKHLGMNVVNHKQQFYLPLTGFGQNGIWWMLLIGLLLFALGGAAWYFVFKKREKLQAVKIPTVLSVQDRINRGE